VGSQKKVIPNPLQRGTTFKVVSWNIDLASPGPAERDSGVMKHLEEHFGDAPESLIVMLQEVRDESLQAILENTWVQRNFAVSDIQAPQSIYKTILGQSFVIKQLEWESYSYSHFTTMLVPRNMSILKLFSSPICH
jgi:tyrosyl-DNA phosphodiesterase 2